MQRLMCAPDYPLSPFRCRLDTQKHIIPVCLANFVSVLVEMRGGARQFYSMLWLICSATRGSFVKSKLRLRWPCGTLCVCVCQQRAKWLSRKGIFYTVNIRQDNEIFMEFFPSVQKLRILFNHSWSFQCTCTQQHSFAWRRSNMMNTAKSVK